MVRFLSNEVFKEFDLGYPAPLRYAVSNFGRVMSFMETFYDGNILGLCKYDGYIILRKKFVVDKKPIYKNYFMHRLVADNFLPGKTPDKTFVIHKDYHILIGRNFNAGLAEGHVPYPPGR